MIQFLTFAQFALVYKTDSLSLERKYLLLLLNLVQNLHHYVLYILHNGFITVKVKN